MGEYIVCGWYTADYGRWVAPLKSDLEKLGCAYDFTEANPPGSWEARCRAKPEHLLRAIDRHPDKIVIYLDVDCHVIGGLDELVAPGCDVAFHIRARRRWNGDLKFAIRPGTYVSHPTAAARALAENWADECRRAPWGDVDQTPLALALVRTRGLVVRPLPVEFCATAGDKVRDPYILHDSASRGRAKVGKISRLASNLILRWRPA